MLELKQIAEMVLAHAKKIAATDVELSASRGTGFDVNVYQGEVDKVEYQNDHAFNVTIYRGQSKGSASTTCLSENNILSTVDAANEIAKISAKDEFAGLADASLMAHEEKDLSLCHPWSVSTEEAIVLAKKLEAKGLAYDKRIVNSDGVSVSSHQGKSLYANSHGFVGEKETTRHDMTCVLVAAENNMMERDYYYDQKRDANDLLSLDDIANRAAKNTVMRLSPRKIKTCQSPVIFSAELACGLIRQFVSAISGASLYRKASFLLDHINKKVFADHINIYEKPFLHKSIGGAWFDSDGVATCEKHFVEAGVLSSYSLGHYSAQRLGMKTTANADGVHNLFVESRLGADDDLLKTMGRGLLLTDLLGHGGNLVTGDYSTGACGYWVEDGEIQYPVAEITVAAKLQDMFNDLIAIGNDVDQRGNVRTGSMLFKAMTIAGE